VPISQSTQTHNQPLAIIMPLTITFALAQNQTFELRSNYGTRRLETNQLNSLINLYKQNSSDLIKIGKHLYNWLDGKEGWLRKSSETIYLNLIKDAEDQALNNQTQSVVLGLSHLPWELLHDGRDFLINKGNESITIVRQVKESSKPNLERKNRPLRLLFMATSPEVPKDFSQDFKLLDYQKEENDILEATKRQPPFLIIEESGNTEELKNLIDSYNNDYFDVFHLTGHGTIYNSQEKWSTLAGDKKIPDNTPCVITEDEFGNPVFTTSHDLAKAFGKRFPPVIFLSCCHTANSNEATMPSMAQELIKAGANVVLGWANPVKQSTSIVAATEFYYQLAIGATVEEATKSAQQKMIEENCPDWYKLRIYRDTCPIESLVTPLKESRRERLPNKILKYLDDNNEIEIANRLDFLGARRLIQRSLKALQPTSDEIGILIEGFQGKKEATIAARLYERFRSQNRDSLHAVIVGLLDEDTLLRKLEDKYERFGISKILKQPGISLTGRLQNFFEKIETIHKPLVLILHNFEENIPQQNIDDDSLKISQSAYSTLEAICHALQENNASSKLIITSEYYKKEAFPGYNLHVVSFDECNGL
jgi:CHAT domain